LRPLSAEAQGRPPDTGRDGGSRQPPMRAGLPAWSSSEAVADGPFFGRVSLNPPRQVAPAGRPRKPPFMNGDPNRVEEATRAALPRDGRRDARLEQRLRYLAGEQARLEAGPPVRRFLRGASAPYCRFLLTADPAHRFHCWVTIRTVSAGLDHLERGKAGHQVAGSAPDGLDPERPSVAALADRVP
jgi:hypothetical protein